MRIALLAGDGIGPEITAEAVKILKAVVGSDIEFDEGLIGGAAWKVTGHPLPEETLNLCRKSDAILFGAVGDPECDNLERALRPEQAILGLRKALDLFANLRPAKLFPELEAESPLRTDIASGTDLVIVRELTGDVYFGTPRGQRKDDQGRREGFDTMRYNEDEVKRIARIGFETARARSGHLCSIDKSNVLETSQLWRTVVLEIAAEYPDVDLSHMYVDNAAMQLVRAPDQFDVIVTGNLFGDILSDLASACVGSIGLLPSASLNSEGKGLYEPIHGSAPDIAGQGKANPLATILSGAMMLRYTLKREEEAVRIEKAVATALAKGARTQDLGGKLSTSEMGNAVLAAL
ncbi:3-isopropylmalate dehydrogenase [Zymomonas mobilis]|uniref:3-isopropylmalate dehydrogenase n=1 Tax=Zymomonas mobilis subsp. pomaceae (strain ATCC 29192 / DSM 22645 / JCM 10191 / CCUG 17912 / NBRC 13757 / NCIMB 11200 / NRRL B-4491 / Barker I) TaxID=579138 RepID=F8EVX8_ZYMMT|nr:3-isopropylmalate dehydrogenase [Zymomonas mobilis]AEI37455.1 3-isopropylmalate dehydrogenase [Zymomonas mobilis subsp. pomaceae ATCC 29192]MDX5948822.1 3-isopropylmalate dehydrogenase [Zymomonas mobilis subsp. pomaceae]GEB88630.1 3-isopropylmalate dehydrogenase [Zymomonas mobilis subsp. pomaceae]